MAPDGLIVGKISEYASTLDYLKLTRLSKHFRTQLSDPSSQLDSENHTFLHISSQKANEMYIHSAFKSIVELESCLMRIQSSGLIISSLSFPLADLSYILDIIFNHRKLANFHVETRYLSAIRFIHTHQECATSNKIPIQGGHFSLFKRRIPALLSNDSEDGSSNHTQSALGIKLESDSVWIVRAVAMTGDRRVDLKAGSTKQDPLRTPSGTQRGTWSDLCPVENDYGETEPVIFLVEFMYNS